MRTLADDCNIVIKKTDRSSGIVIWDRNDYITEAENQLKSGSAYKS